MDKTPNNIKNFGFGKNNFITENGILKMREEEVLKLRSLCPINWDDLTSGKIMNPGCYIIYANRVCLYVGYSRDIRKRVSRFYRFGYIGKNMNPDMAEIILKAEYKEMSFIYTDTKQEAMQLEKALIEWLNPKFKSESTDLMKLVNRSFRH